MKRIFLALLAAASLAQGAEPAKITVDPVTGSIYMLRSDAGANVIVSVGDDGIVMVDDQDASVAAQMLETVKTLSAKPIRFVINTHVHEDHTGGNDFFQKIAPVIAHDNTRARMASGERKRAAEALPTVTFDNELVLHVNEDIRLLKLPAGHTDGDVAVFFTKSNVVAMGDVFMPPAASYVDRSNGGTILGLIEELEFVLPLIPADAKVIPGHGEVSSRAEVARGLEVLKEMKVIVQTGVAAGKTLEQLVAEKPFEKWKDLIASWAKTDSYVGRFYRELTGTK